MKEELWEAIIHCNSLYDGKFFYGVETTGIFCRPSCRSKNPKRQNVRVFSSAEEAISENFRPCKRCQPDVSRNPDAGLVNHVIELIQHRYSEPITLLTLANMLHISPYHLHRTFKRLTGQTPAQYLKATRFNVAQKLLTTTELTISEIAMMTGFPNVSHFSTIFLKQFGLVPTAWRRQSEAHTSERR